MSELFNLDALREVLVHVFSELGGNVAAFLPNLVGAVLIFALGWLVSSGLEMVAGRGLRALGLDRAAARLKIADLLDRAGLNLSFSEIVARLLFWLVMLTFLLSAVETLGLKAVTTTIDRLIAFIPNVIGAALIGLGGLVLGRFVATLVSSGAAAAGLLSAPRLGFMAQIAVVGLMLAIAAEQLGIAVEVFVLPLTVMVGAAGLAVGLAFALGARPLITHILAGHFMKQSFPENTAVEIDGRRGLVERVGAVDTLVRSDDEVWSVPNAHLLERVVLR